MNNVLQSRGYPLTSDKMASVISCTAAKKPAYKLTDLWRAIYHELRNSQFDAWTTLEDRRAMRALCHDMNNKELVMQLPLRADMLRRAEALLNKKIDSYNEEEEEIYTNGRDEDIAGFDHEIRRLREIASAAGAWAQTY